MSDNREVVTFTSMAEGTREDYELLDRLEAEVFQRNGRPRVDDAS